MPGTLEYVQSVEVAMSYDGMVPEGMDVIELPAAKYDPATIEAQWDTGNPRIQLEAIGTRGYIEPIPRNSYVSIRQL